VLPTSSKAPRHRKTPSPAPKEAVALQAAPAEKVQIKTVLVASYGWPTADMQPSRRQTARR
jgi:hypothetical protein